MGDAGSIDGARLQSQPLVLADSDLAVFVLNVGDGDSIVVRFPANRGRQSYAIIDSNDAQKTINLVDTLQQMAAPGQHPQVRFLCATHPHADHIRGLRAILRHFGSDIDEFWDSGFRTAHKTYAALIREVAYAASNGQLRFVRPTSGFEIFHAGARITVLSPSIALRNRYDTYGTSLNNASVVLRIAYPSPSASLDYPATNDPEPAQPWPRARVAVLGGDAQTDAWGLVLGEFPHLHRDPGNWARRIRPTGEVQPLACDFFKVSHHASKRGVNLELIERLGDRSGFPLSKGPRYMAVSCASGGGSSNGFPHSITHELLREVRDPIATTGLVRKPDVDLGIHLTSQLVDGGASAPAGSIAFVVSDAGDMTLFRMRDEVDDPIHPNLAVVCV